MRIMTRATRKLWLVMLASLAACGGGGGDGDGGLLDVISGTSITLTATAASPTSINLSWSAPSGGVSVSSYNVSRDDSGSTSVIGSTSSRNYTAAGLVPGTQYCFVIKNPLTAGKMSNTACATTAADSQPPSAPAGLTANDISPGAVNLEWQFSSDNDFVSGYNIYRDGALILTASGRIATDSTANADATHCYRVTAVDRAGNESAPSGEACVTMPPDFEPPTAPSMVTATIGEVDGQPAVEITWNAATDNGVVRYYRVFRNDVYLADATTTSYQDTGVEADSSYCYTVTAVDGGGNESDPSEPACAREGWQKQSFESTNTLGTAVVVDSGGTVHIGYKEHTSDTTLRAIRIPLTYVRLEAGEAPVSRVLRTGAETFFFNDAYRLAMAVDGNNVAHIAHKWSDPPFSEAIQHFQVEAASSTLSTIQESQDNMDSISLAVDSVGAIHACYGLSGTLYYATNGTGVWQSTDVASLVAGTAGGACDIATGNDDSIHMSFLERSTRELMYLSNRSGSWVAERLDLPGSINYHTSIAVDPAGHPHIAHFNSHVTDASGSWVIETFDSDGSVGYDAEIATDSQGFVHIVYRDHTTDKLVRYADNGTGNWITDILSTADTGEMAIAVDSLDKLHVTFSDGGKATYMTNRQ